jgi:hypothetical protein
VWYFGSTPKTTNRGTLTVSIDDAEVIADLRLDGTVGLADRDDAVRGNAKRSDVRKVLDAASECFEQLVELWEEVHRA